VWVGEQGRSNEFNTLTLANLIELLHPEYKCIQDVEVLIFKIDSIFHALFHVLEPKQKFRSTPCFALQQFFKDGEQTALVEKIDSGIVEHESLLWGLGELAQKLIFLLYFVNAVEDISLALLHYILYHKTHHNIIFIKNSTPRMMQKSFHDAIHLRSVQGNSISFDPPLVSFWGAFLLILSTKKAVDLLIYRSI
jgi:hypothetical protein